MLSVITRALPVVVAPATVNAGMILQATLPARVATFRQSALCEAAFHGPRLATVGCHRVALSHPILSTLALQRAPRQCLCCSALAWISWRRSAIFSLLKASGRGARCLQRISAHLSPRRRSLGFPLTSSVKGAGHPRVVE
jgi:hypothetical protein